MASAIRTRAFPTLTVLAVTMAQLPYVIGGACVWLIVPVLAFVATLWLLRGSKLI